MSGLLAGTLARRALDDAVLVAIAPPTLMRSMAAGRRALRTRRQADESGLAAAALYLRHTAGCRPRRLGPSRLLHMIHRARLASATEMVAAGFISQLFELSELETTVRDLVEVLPARAPLTMWATKATLQRLRLRAMPEDDDILSTVYGGGLQSRRASVRHQTACPVDRTVSGAGVVGGEPNRVAAAAFASTAIRQAAGTNLDCTHE